MVYNLTNLSNAYSFSGQLVETNILLAGIPAALILLITWLILFVAFKRYPVKADFVVSSFITSIMAIFFLYLELIGWAVAIAPILLFFGSLIVYLFSDE